MKADELRRRLERVREVREEADKGKREATRQTVEALEAVRKSKGAVSMREATRLLGITRNAAYKALEAKGRKK